MTSMFIRKKLERLFTASLILTLAAVSTNFISFVSPYWVQSIPSAHSQFQRIGLWTACFNGYMRPDDFNKAYFGCYYIYFVEYDRIRTWINPVWLYCIQVLSSAGMLIHSLVAFVILCQATKSIDRDDRSVSKFILFGHFSTCITLAASLVAFAVARYDTQWMPYPSTNVLSWAYGVAALSFFLTLLSFIVVFVRYLYLDLLTKEDEEALLQPERKVAATAGDSGIPPGEPDYPETVDGEERFHERFNDEPIEEYDPEEVYSSDPRSSNQSNGYENSRDPRRA